MKVRSMVKRIFALGAGAAMLGATLAGAYALSPSQAFPDKFVTNGAFNGYIVVGDNALAPDVQAQSLLATNLWYQKPSETSTVTLEGDNWKVGTSTNMLELRENIYDVNNYIGSDELEALADGSITNNKGTSSYKQYLYFDTNSATTDIPLFAVDDDDNMGLFYYVQNGEQIGRYYLEFTESLQSDYDSTDGWKDIKDEKLNIMGKTYDIVTATNTSNGPKLTLMGGSTKDTLLEGNSKTYTVNGKDYEVNLLYTNTGAAKFTVNGESTDELSVGETDKLSDGTTIGLSEVLYQGYAGGVHSATFFLGADKVVLENGQSLEVGDETYSESTVSISYSETNSVLTVDSIGINMTADDDYYVPVDGKLTDVMQTPESLLGNWDIEFKGLADNPTEELKLSPYSGDEKYKLYFTTSNGEDVVFPLFYSNSSANTIFGGEKDGYGLVLNASSGISRHQYFVLNTADADSYSADAKTFVLQYDGRDKTSDSNAKARFTVLGSGSIERPLGSDGTFDLKLGGHTFNFVNTSSGATKNGPVKLNSATDEAYTSKVAGTDQYAVQLRTSNNVEVTITDTNTSADNASWTVDINVDDVDRMNTLSTAQHVIYTFAKSDSSYDIDASIGSTAQTNRPIYWESNPDNDNQNVGYDLYGTKVVEDSPSSGSKTETLTIPNTQSEALLYVTSGATTSTTTSGGDTVAAKVPSSAYKLASKVSDLKAQNVIAVGGPCANPAAAELLGNPSDCAAGFEPGRGKVQVWEWDNGNVAMLVAGYSADDTWRTGLALIDADKRAEMTEDVAIVEATSDTDLRIKTASEVAAEAATSADTASADTSADTTTADSSTQ